MEAMQRLRAEVAENPKAAMRHLKDGVEDRVFEHLLKRRGSSGSGSSSTLTTVSSDTTSFSSSSSSSRSGESDVVDEPVEEKAAAGGGGGDGDVSEQLENSSVYLNNSEGTEIASSQINGKVDESAAKRTEIREVISILHGKAVGRTLAGPIREEEHDEHDESAAATDDADDLGEIEEEVVELEFERAVQTMHNHEGYGMYCPNCSNQITRVVLRRKIRRRPVAAGKEDHRLVGCLSCFSIFVPSGNRLNPFRIFGGGVSGEGNQLQQAEGTGCNPLWIFRREKHPVNSPSEESTQKPQDVVTHPGKRNNVWWLFGKGNDQETSLVAQPPGSTQPPREVVIDVEKPEGNVPSPDAGVASNPSVEQPLLVTESGSSRSVEIVKSVVYGGLMESMASLSVVSSAAASDSTTLNILVLGLANLVGGLVVLFHNLKDLRYGESGQTDEEIELRYKKELGKRQHFPLHVFLAVLSYIVFGLLPPAIYGSTFRESNDRDYKMLAVAAASLLCVFMLAVAKAYARGERSFSGYFKTVSYYISAAVMVAGISFAVGELAEKFVKQIGWLEPSAPAQVSGIQIQPTWASSF